MSTKSNSSGADTIEAITARLVEAIENGAGTWSMPWSGANGAPFNATTGNRYTGGNCLALWIEAQINAYSSPEWATYKQWSSIGGQVRKGSTGTRLVRWVEKKRKDDDDTKTAGDDTGEQHAKRMIPVSFTVFNAGQIDGTDIEVTTPPPLPGNFAHFFDAVPARIAWGEGQPCYRPATDTVVMPDWDRFRTTADGFATLAHELGHWTGHPSRLARDLTGRFGSESYAMEELVAELSAAFTCSHVGIPTANRHADHAAYLSSWLKVLKAEPRALWTVASAAQAAADHLATYSEPAAAKAVA